MIDLAIFLTLLALGYGVGQYAERRHYRSILEREARLNALPAIAARFPPAEPHYRQALVYGSTVVSVDLFPTLGVPPLLGRGFTPEEAKPGGPRVVVVSHAYWQRRLDGSPEVVGSTLNVDGNASTVVGVMPAGFRIRSNADLWFPMVDDPAYTSPAGCTTGTWWDASPRG